MATEAQITANRSNAKESTGPKTTEGKATVSQNAIKHGLTAQRTVIPGENLADFELYRYEMIEELDPLGPMESMLADRIVSLSWRLRRTMRFQNETIHALCVPIPLSGSDKYFNDMHSEYAGEFKSDVDQASRLGRSIIKDFSNARVLDRLMMYERRIESSLYKTVRELQKLKLTRKFGPHAAPHTTCRGVALAKTDIPADRSLNMQNKPNSQNAELDLTSDAHSSYEPESPLPTPPNQTQPNPIKPNLTPKTTPEDPPHRRSKPLGNPNRRSRRAGSQIPC